MRRRQRLSESGDTTFFVFLAAGVLGVLAGDWLATAGLLLLWLAWYLLRSDEGPPVLALAFTFQWIQAICGIIYCGVLHRSLRTLELASYRRVSWL